MGIVSAGRRRAAPAGERAALRRSSIVIRLQKAAAAIVVGIALGAQTYAILRPSGARLWPFVDYPMYSAAHDVGDVVQGRAFYAIGCGAEPQVWRFEPHALGYQGAWLHRHLRAIAKLDPAAAQSRAEIAHAVARFSDPRACALEIWARTITVTAEGIDAPSFDRVATRRLVRWSVDAPDVVVDLRGEDAP